MNRPETEGPVPAKEEGRIAVCGFQNRVCPRFDLTREVLILDGQKPEEAPVEVIDVASLSADERFQALAGKGIKVLIVGGIQDRFQEMLSLYRIQVIWGVMGEIKEVIQAYQKGLLYPGVGSIPQLIRPKRQK